MAFRARTTRGLGGTLAGLAAMTMSACGLRVPLPAEPTAAPTQPAPTSATPHAGVYAEVRARVADRAAGLLALTPHR